MLPLEFGFDFHYVVPLTPLPPLPEIQLFISFRGVPGRAPCHVDTNVRGYEHQAPLPQEAIGPVQEPPNVISHDGSCT